MRFSSSQQLAIHLFVATTLLTVALTGALSPVWLAGVAIVALPLTYLHMGPRPRATRLLHSRLWSVAVALLMFVILAATALEVARGAPSLSASARCLCALLVIKLLHRRAAGDDLQLVILCLLALAVGAALDPGPAFALGLVATVACGTWALALLHLRRDIEENHHEPRGEHHARRHHGTHPASTDEGVTLDRVLGSRRIVDRSFVFAAAALALASVGLAALLFPALPRLGGALSPRRSHTLAIGFDDRGVELGRNGLPTATDEVVMRVEFPDGRPSGPLYFRGASFCDYSSGRWTTHPAARLPLRQIEGRAVVGVPSLPDVPAPTDPPRGTLRQTIYLEPLATTALFAASMPTAFALPPTTTAPPPLLGTWLDPALRVPTDDVSLSGRSGSRRSAILRYAAWSHPAEPPATPTTPLTSDETDTLAACLDTSGLSPRAVSLARSLTDGFRDPWAKTQAVLAWLARDHRYTTTLVHTDGRDPLDEFLFERRAGHCEYFASALALLLRAAGVPTRHVVGFHGGDWNQVGGYLVVRQRHAHAWVEVYLGAAGWVLVDPTPASTPPTATHETEPTWHERSRQALDALGFAWERHVLDFDATAWRRLWGRVYGGTVAGLTRLSRRGVAGAGLVATALVAAWFWRKRGQRRAQAVGLVARETERWLGRALRALERRGLRRAPGETMAALARRAERLGDPGARAFTELVALHDATRFGGHPSDEERLTELSAQVAHAAPLSDERSI